MSKFVFDPSEPRVPLASDFIVLDHNVNMDVDKINPGWIATNHDISQMIYLYATTYFNQYNRVDEKEFSRQFVVSYNHLPNLNLIALIEYAINLRKEYMTNQEYFRTLYAYKP